MFRTGHAGEAAATTRQARAGQAIDAPVGTLGLGTAMSPAWSLAILAVVASLAAAVTLTPYPPLQDFLEWVYQGKLVALLASGAELGSIRVAPYPVPNSMTQVIMGLLSLVMPAPMAAVIFLLGFVAAASMLAWALAKRYQPAVAGPLGLMLIVSVFFAAPFWSGYSNYVFSLLLFGAFLLVPKERWTGVATVLVFSIALFFTHLITFAAFLLLVGVNALARRRVWPVVLALAPSLALAAWYYLALDRSRVDAGEALVSQQQYGHVLLETAKFLAYKFYTVTKTGPYHNFVFAAGGDVVVRPIVYWAGVLLNCAYALALILLLALGMRNALRRRTFLVVPVVAGLLLALAFLLMPSGRLIVNAGERFMYPALLLLLLFLPLHPRLTQILGGAAVLLLVSLVALTSARQDWRIALPEASWDAPQRVLFQHRPTAFAESWFATERLEAEGVTRQLQISFETSLLISDRLGGGKPKP